MDLVPNIIEFQKSIVSDSNQRTVFITFAGFWEDRTVVPDDFFETIDTVSKTAEGVIMLGVPRVSIWRKYQNSQTHNSCLCSNVKSLISHWSPSSITNEEHHEHKSEGCLTGSWAMRSSKRRSLWILIDLTLGSQNKMQLMGAHNACNNLLSVKQSVLNDTQLPQASS